MEITDKGSQNTINIAESSRTKPSNKNAKVIISGNNNTINIMDNVTCPNVMFELRDSHSEITIGDRCIIRGNIRCRADNSIIRIGSGTTFMNAMITAHEAGLIQLGEDCMLSGNIRIDVSDMHSILDAKTMKRINPPGDVKIGDHVWIGQGVYITKNVTIGNNSVIGACAVVTKDVPNGCVAAGNPAKIIKKNITWDRNRLPF